MTISLHQHVSVAELVTILVVEAAVWGVVIHKLKTWRARRRERHEVIDG